MIKIGLLRETKIPVDSRVAFTPSQCKWIAQHYPGVKLSVQSSPGRCFSDREYRMAGIEVRENIDDCDVFLGIKEVDAATLLPGKTYLFFSHTRKKQEYNRHLFQTILQQKITLIDYECMEHDDGQRILGFGFFAGVVGAHNGIMAYGNRSGAYTLPRVYTQKSFRDLIHTYFGLRLPPIKIAVTGSGRVARGILEIMNLMEVAEVEPDEYLERRFTYPVFVQLKGRTLYASNSGKAYRREEFHYNPSAYHSLFYPYTRHTDILMNGTYWDTDVPRLFEKEHVQEDGFRIQTIADITNDTDGSVPCNLGDSTIPEPVYGVDRQHFYKTPPYLPGSVDMMAVGNLPDELPRDASRYFGEQLLKYILDALLTGGSTVIERATMVKAGQITAPFGYLKEYGNFP